MKLRCIAVDDEPIALDKLSDYIERVPFLELLGSFDDGLSALAFLQTSAVDLVFLDIQMPHLNGLQLVKVLPKNVQVVFCTAYSEYALEGYTLNITDYLMKPIAFDRLLQAAQKALDKHQKEHLPSSISTAQPREEAPGFIFVKTEFKLQKVSLADIKFVQGMKDYLMLHTPKEKIMTLQSFKKLQDKLPSQEFVRVHKSYIVALSHIDYIERQRIAIGNELIPISDTYKDAFYKLLEARGIL